ncbi:MAG: hypothetical protein ACPLZF_02610 [Nitrososphaeria archaeon]
MRILVAPIIFAVLLAAVVMLIPAYFIGYSSGQMQRVGSEGYGTVKSPQPAAAIESSQTATATSSKGISLTDVLIMLFASLTISLFVTILFIKIRG